MSDKPKFPEVKVAVVLLTYNNVGLLEGFLPRIVETTPTNGDYRIFVIDNASTDNTQEFLSTFGNAIDIITVPVNKGFTNGYKTGLAQIDADYFVLVSSDVEVTDGWLEPAIAMFEEDPGIAVVQPKIKSWHQKEEFEYAGACGGFIDYQCYPFCRGRIFYSIEQDLGQYEEEREIFWASGACFFIRAPLYEESGGLDDDFFAHMEEIDLCWRLKNRGYKIMVCPQSEVYHIGGAVISYGSPQKVFRNHRNNLIMMFKNLPGNELLWKILLRLAMDALAFFNMVYRGQVKASFSIIHAHMNFYANMPKWIKKRRETQRWVVCHSRSGIYPKSIVYQYFVRRKTRFSELNW